MTRRWLLALAALTALATRAHALEQDYAPESSDWNGLSGFAGLAGSVGLEVVPVEVLDWDTVTPRDAVAVIYPLAPIEPAQLLAFVRAGGRLLVADDRGRSSDALAALGILRDTGPPRASRLYNDDPDLPIATGAARDPIAGGITRLYTNVPASFSVEGDRSVAFKFDQGGALLVHGTLGEGRFFALADPSVLINGMLAFDENATVASNLARAMAPSDGAPARLFLVTHTFVVRGEPPSVLDKDAKGGANQFLADFSTFLDEANDYLASDAMLRALAALVAVAGAAFALLAIFRRRAVAPVAPWALADEGAALGHAALVAAADEGRSPSFVPAATLRELTDGHLAPSANHPEALALEPAELHRRLATALGARAAEGLRADLTLLRGLPTRAQALTPWAFRARPPALPDARAAAARVAAALARGKE